MPQSWDKNLPSASRFTILSEFNSEAVRDNNTGLVWERSPETHGMEMRSAAPYCANKIIGGAAGWRLPELWIRRDGYADQRRSHARDVHSH